MSEAVELCTEEEVQNIFIISDFEYILQTVFSAQICIVSKPKFHLLLSFRYWSAIFLQKTNCQTSEEIKSMFTFWSKWLRAL